MTAKAEEAAVSNNQQQQAPERQAERVEATPGLNREIEEASKKTFDQVAQEWSKEGSAGQKGDKGTEANDKSGDGTLKTASGLDGQRDGSPESRAKEMGMTVAELQRYESGQIDFNKNPLKGLDDKAPQGSEQAAMVAGAAPASAEARTLQDAQRGSDGNQAQMRAGGDSRAQVADRANEAQDRPGGQNAGDVDGALKRLQEGGWLRQGADGKFQTGDKFTDKTAKGHFGEQVTNFLNRSDITPEQKASVLNSTAQLLEMRQGENSVLSQQHRELLATTQLENLSNWKSDDQGNSNRCNVAQLAGARNYLAPEKVAEMTNNIAKDGFWDIPANESSTGEAKRIYMGEALQNTNKGLDGNKGDSNEAGKLHQIALAKEFNERRGLLYEQGQPTPNNPTGETTRKISGYDNQGRPVGGELVGKGSPAMTMADVADAAKSKELGIANNVTAVADQSWKNGRTTNNLETIRNPGDMQRIVENAQKQDKHYIIMGVSGADRSVADASGRRDVARNDGHYAHAIGAAWSKTHDINPRTTGDKNGGEWAGNNTWGNDRKKVNDKGEVLGNDDIWDRNLVGADGKMNIATAERAMDMKIDRKGSPGFDGSQPYKDWHQEHPGVNRREGGVSQVGDNPKIDELNKKKEEQNKKPEEEQKKKADSGEFDQQLKLQRKQASEIEFAKLQQESRRIESDIAAGLGNTAALYGKLSSIHGMMQIVA